MAAVMWHVAVDAALLSFVVCAVASDATSTTTGLHLPSEEHPLPTRTTSVAGDFRSNRTEVLTRSNGTTTTTAIGNSSTSSETSGTVKDIWLIGLFPLRGSWAGGLGQLPAVEMGIEDVNADPNILPGYRLKMTINDTAVSSDNGLLNLKLKNY